MQNIFQVDGKQDVFALITPLAKLIVMERLEKN
jgi:hypothetical protein